MTEMPMLPHISRCIYVVVFVVITGSRPRKGTRSSDVALATSKGRPTSLVRPFGIGRSQASTADRLGPYGRKNSPRCIDATSEPQPPAPLGSKWGRGGLCAVGVAATTAAYTSQARAPSLPPSSSRPAKSGWLLFSRGL
uniref:Uncharacterized protein n=1 Tax=Oryza meridionalis TaxID=40149 RepID=A0A0E0CJZ1_9ORYZ